MYKAVFNQNAEARQKYVLKKMLETEKITKEQYEEAISQPLENFVKPGIKKNAVINFSYYTDLVQNQVVEKLMSKLGYTREEAKNKLVNGGLRIYSAIDKNIVTSRCKYSYSPHLFTFSPVSTIILHVLK